MKLLNTYQYVGPLILFPAAYYLLLRRLDHDYRLVLFMLSMPILYAYIIPGIGANLLKLWEFKTRWRLGRFRPHNGFVFGSAISLLAFLVSDTQPLGIGAFELIRTGLVTGSTIAFWIWLYDIYALKTGFLVIYSRPHYRRLGAEAIATDYAPVIFFTFGFVYGLAIHVGRYYLRELGRWDLFWPLIVACNAVVLTAPGFAFVIYSLMRYGDPGLRPYTGGEDIPGSGVVDADISAERSPEVTA